MIIHAFFLHRRGTKNASSKENEEGAFEEEELFSRKEGSKFGLLKEQPLNEDFGAEPLEEEKETEAKYPMYQEYPEGSGRHWVMYGADLEWELIDV